MLSQFDPSITLEQLRYQHEGHYFDRKSARISSKKLMEVLSSFSNADGGLIVVGIENDGEISGLEMDESAANRCHQAAREYLETVPLYELEIVSVMSDEKESSHCVCSMFLHLMIESLNSRIMMCLLDKATIPFN